MTKRWHVPLSIAIDMAAVVAAYLLAVIFRVGGRLETAQPEEAVVTAVAAALAHGLGNAAVGAYRRDWPKGARSLALLALPAITVGGAIALLNAVSSFHAIPYAAIIPGATLALALEVALHLRTRFGRIASAVAGRNTALPDRIHAVADLPDLDTLVVPVDASLRHAVSVIDRDVARIALIVDGERVLRGVVTDGDVRRALLAGAQLDGPASTAMTTHPVVAPTGTSDDEILDLMQRHAVRQVPILDEYGRVADIRILDLLHREERDLCPVLIMAGGLGTRLGDLTRKTPKPLMRVGGRPILSLLIEDLASQGFRRILLAVNYRADLIEEHVGDGSRYGVDVAYIRETEPLGTAGAIRLAAPHVSEPELMVTNADLLTRVNFRELLSFHRREAHELTVGVIESTLQLRYGLIETKGTRVVAIREKPALKHFINAGIYVLDRGLSDLVPEGRFDMDALINTAMKRHVVGCFPIHEYWTDIGEPADLRRAADDFKIETIRRISE